VRSWVKSHDQIRVLCVLRISNVKIGVKNVGLEKILRPMVRHTTARNVHARSL